MKRKAFTITVALLLAVFVSLSMTDQVNAQAFEPDPVWAGYSYKGDDDFYGANVVAYESESTAVLYVSVRNNYGKQMNVSAVGISLNWGETFNSTQANKTSPVTLENGEYRIFTITFEVPSTANVSNLFRWDYEIYLEHFNATGYVYPWYNRTRRVLDLPYFVVYSTEQAKCRQMATTIDGISSLAPWNSTKAKILWNKKENETNVAKSYYDSGDFSNAATHYENALSLIDQAFTAEDTKTTRWEDAQIALLEAQGKYYEGWSNFFSGLSNMATLIGVALVFLALGYIIRGLAVYRRASAPP